MTTASTEKIKLGGLKKVSSVANIQNNYRLPEKSVKLRNNQQEDLVKVEPELTPILR